MTTYEDTDDHLSESEREVTRLIFTLAGYLPYNVYETVPYILLDSLESIDASRIATLSKHFGKDCDYLLVALLSEDANTWTLISRSRVYSAHTNALDQSESICSPKLLPRSPRQTTCHRNRAGDAPQLRYLGFGNWNDLSTSHLPLFVRLNTTVATANRIPIDH